MNEEKLNEALSLYNQGNKLQAANLFAEIVRQDPKNSAAWYGLALCLDDPDKKIYCLKRVLRLDPSHTKAQQILEKLQVVEELPNSQKTVSDPPSSIAKKESTFNPSWISILGIGGVMIICLIVGVVLLGGMNAFKPTPTPIPPTRTPRPSPTPSILTGEPIEYLPNLPNNFEIDYSIPNVNTTSQDGTVLFSIGFRNKQASIHGDLVTVIYYINIYSSETKANSEYHKYMNNLESSRKGTIENDISLDGADQSAMYIEVQDGNVLLGQYISRVKNVFITTMGQTSYDPQDVTEAFLKSFMADVGGVHILGIDKLSR